MQKNPFLLVKKLKNTKSAQLCCPVLQVNAVVHGHVGADDVDADVDAIIFIF